MPLWNQQFVSRRRLEPPRRSLRVVQRDDGVLERHRFFVPAVHRVVVVLFVLVFVVLVEHLGLASVDHVPLDAVERLQLLGVRVEPRLVQGQVSVLHLGAQILQQTLGILQILGIGQIKPIRLPHVLQVVLHCLRHVVIEQRTTQVPRFPRRRILLAEITIVPLVLRRRLPLVGIVRAVSLVCDTFTVHHPTLRQLLHPKRRARRHARRPRSQYGSRSRCRLCLATVVAVHLDHRLGRHPATLLLHQVHILLRLRVCQVRILAIELLLRQATYPDLGPRHSLRRANAQLRLFALKPLPRHRRQAGYFPLQVIPTWRSVVGVRCETGGRR